MATKTLIVCTYCDWYRERVPNAPADLDLDFQQAQQRDIFGRTIRRD